MLYVAKLSFKNEGKVFFRHMKAKKIYYILMSYYKMQFLKKSGHRLSMSYKKQVSTETDKNV